MANVSGGGIRLAEMIHEHNVGVALIDLGEEHIAPVRGNGHPLGKVLVRSEEFPCVLRREIVKADASRIVLEAEINSFRHYCPLGLLKDFGHLRDLLGRGAREIRCKHHYIRIAPSQREV